MAAEAIFAISHGLMVPHRGRASLFIAANLMFAYLLQIKSDLPATPSQVGNPESISYSIMYMHTYVNGA